MDRQALFQLPPIISQQHPDVTLLVGLRLGQKGEVQILLLARLHVQPGFLYRDQTRVGAGDAEAFRLRIGVGELDALCNALS